LITYLLIIWLKIKSTIDLGILELTKLNSNHIDGETFPLGNHLS
jgi:hypothetical protein